MPSAGGENTNFPFNAVATLPTIFSHRDVGATDCPGNVAYGLLDEIRETAAHFSGPPRPEDLVLSLQGGAIYDRWQTIGGPTSILGAPTSPEATGDGGARYADFDRGAMYWSPKPVRKRSPEPSTTRGLHSATSGEPSACRPAPNSKSRNG